MPRLLVGFALLLIGSIFAQTGLPTYGVLLNGPPNAPIIINNSGHRILAYTLMFDKGNGAHVSSAFDMSGQLSRRPISSVGIAPGASFQHGASPGGAAQPEVRNAAGVPSGPADGALGVELDSVWFDDGSFVGPDKAGSFDQFTAHRQAEQDVHALLVNAKGSEAAWTTLSEMASGHGTVTPAGSAAFQRNYAAFSRRFADQLVRARASLGDARAMAMAQGPADYPKLLRVSQ